MKALYVAKPSDELRLTYGDVPEPQIVEPTDVLVRVRAAALNRLDLFRAEGSHGASPLTFPYVGGSEYAGTVVATGSAVTHVKPGDRVFGTGSPTFAEYSVAKLAGQGPHQRPPLKMPEGLTFEEASAIPISFCMAWHMLHCKGELKSGETVLVIGASSGTGSSGIQLAKAAGARVITTVSSDAKYQAAKKLGADEIINYREIPKFSQRVLSITNGKGVDMVFDHVGAPVWEECFKSIRSYGRMIICGVTGGHWAKIHLGQLWSRNLTLIGCTNEPENDFEHIVTLIEHKTIRGVVDSVFPLELGNEAYSKMDKGEFFGKIVLQIP